ncbi:MAG TPA: hypothetical protein VHY08_21165 [Bacillota bacterium]|nr:hypothetical protein [Bacillota bacterium]
MKKLVGLLFVILLMGVTILAGCGPSPAPTPTPAPTPISTPIPTPIPTVAPGQYIVHYDGEPAKGSGSANCECLVHFNTTKLANYVGCKLTGIQIFFYNDGVPYALNFTAKIYNGDGGTISSPGTLIYSGGYTLNRGVWNQVLLDNPIPITSGLELWAGFSLVYDGSIGTWPISNDGLPEVPKTSYMRVGTGSWGEYSTNHNIRLILLKD